MATPFVHPGTWAKLSREPNQDGEYDWHPLVAHCCDVGAVFEQLCLNTIIGERFSHLLGSPLTKVQIQRLSFLAFLHDIGKVSASFQLERGKGGHVRPLLDCLCKANDSKFTRRLRTLIEIRTWGYWFEKPSNSSCLNMLYSILCHHGSPLVASTFAKDRVTWESRQTYSPMEQIEMIVEVGRRMFPVAFSDKAGSFPETPEFFHYFNGVLTLADWMGSDAKFFPYRSDLREPKSLEDEEFEFWATTHIQKAREGALRAVEAFGLKADDYRDSLKEATFANLVGNAQWEPRPVQQKVMELPASKPGSLLVIESDTGSGKTEAALLHFFRLYKEGLVDGVYFALPLRTAAKQIEGRIRDAVEKMFSEKAPPVTLALSGYMISDGVEAVCRLPGFEVLWPDARSQRDYELGRSWACEDSKRFLAGSIIAGTIDQALLSVLKTKHAHLRGSCLSRLLLVVDEVHASDVYMNNLLSRVLCEHRYLGGHAMLMSATLGSNQRAPYFGEEVPSLKDALKVPYPVSFFQNDGEKALMFEATSQEGEQKKVHVHALPLDHLDRAILDQVRPALEAKARVLVICNTVKDCQRIFARALEEFGPEMMFSLGGKAVPHHSRYAAEDRVLLDRQIEKDFGKNTDRSLQAKLCIATQTVEQSLDIDADFLVTALCPIDVLLQRIGRLHRHKVKNRPQGYENPRCLVLAPEKPLVSYIDLGKERPEYCGQGLGAVYENLLQLQKTLELIKEKPTWCIPEDNRYLVEVGTHEESFNELCEGSDGELWTYHKVYLAGNTFACKGLASELTFSRGDEFMKIKFNLGEGALIRATTRLGAEDRKVSFNHPVVSPLCSTVKFKSLNIPQHLLGDLSGLRDEDLEDIEIKASTEGFSFALGKYSYNYSHLGLVSVGGREQ